MIKIISGLFRRLESAIEPGSSNLQSVRTDAHLSKVKQKASSESTGVRPHVEAINTPADQFFRKLDAANTVEACMRLYQNAQVGSSEEDRAATKASKIAVSFDDWLSILTMSDTQQPIGKRAVERLKDLAIEFEQWQQLHEFVEKDSLFAHVATDCKTHMESKAQTLEEWIWIYKNSEEGSPSKLRAFDTLIAQATSDSIWETLESELDAQDPLAMRRSAWRLSQASSLSELESLFDDLNSDNPIIPELLVKVGTRQEPFDDWINCYENRSSADDFDRAVFARMLQLASTPDEYIALADAVEGCSDDDVMLVEKSLSSVAFTKEQWTEIRDGSSDGSFIEVLAFKKLLDFESTSAGIVAFYLDYVDRYSTDDAVVNMVLDKLFSVTTRSEAEIISLLAEDGSDLCERASKAFAHQDATS